jgi:alpha-tubulin suppressor-like RCC1 family protein
MASSSVHGATYTLTVVVPSFSPAAGSWGTAQTVTIATATAGATIRYTTDGTTPTGGSPVYTSALPVSTGTTLQAIALKTGWTTSGVGSAGYFFNYGTLAAPTVSPTPGDVGYGTPVTLSAAAFATIRFTTDGSTPTAASSFYAGPITITGTTTINAKAFHPDWTTSAMAGGTFTVKVSTPAFSPAAGTYAPGQLVTITNGTPGAVIRYTTNGADPTAADLAIVNGGTVVAGGYTLKARGFSSGWTSSEVASAAYALTGPFTNWAVAAGAVHSVGLKNDGTVWTFGANDSGQLGDTTSGRSTAAMVNGVTGIVAISAGARHTLALRSDGTVWGWGDNTVGQLGDNSTTSRSMPAPVTGLSSVTAIATGSNFSVALTSDGSVWAWGYNQFGQLGDGTQVPRLLPTHVPTLSGVVAIAAGADHTVARTSDGSLWSWGSNGFGQLGYGTGNIFASTPVQMPGVVATAGPWAGLGDTFIVTSDGGAWGWGFNSYGQLGVGTTSGAGAPVRVSTVANVVMAAASRGYFSLAIQADGSAWAWGANWQGQLGDGTTSSRLAPYHIGAITNAAGIAAGGSHTVIVTSDGSVWASGSNSAGQLGDGTLDDRWVPVQISEAGFNWKTSTPRLAPSTGTYSANTSVTVSAVTPGAAIHYTTNGVDPMLTDPTVSSGANVIIDQSVTLNARAWAAGMPVSNIASAIYTMTLTAPIVTPAAGTYLATQTVTMTADSGTTIRYTTDGTDPTAASTAYAGAVTIEATTTVKAQAFKAGWTASAIVATSYTLKVVTPAFTPAGGSYGAAQTLAIGTTTPSATIRYTLTGGEPTITSAVYTSAISVSSTATAKAVASRAGWLDSDSGAATFWITQGTADTPTFLPAAGAYSAPMLVQLVSAPSGVLVRYTIDGSDPTSSSLVYQCPIRIAATTTVKARAYREAFTPSAVGSAVYALDAAGAVDTPVIIPAGGRFAAGLTFAVTVQASGATVRYTTSGVDPVATDPVVPVGGIAADRSMTVKVKAWSASATPSAVRRADFVVTGAVSASTGSSHALKADGSVWSWGNNASGQLGDGSTTGRAVPVAAQGLTTVIALASAADRTLAVKADGTVWGWGGTGSLPTQVPGLTQIVAVAAGSTHSVALRSDGSVWSWGGNAAGQLGDGTTTPHVTPTMIAGLSGVSRIAAGDDFTLAVENDGLIAGRVWAWGNNAAGQLGDGSHLGRLAPVQANVPGRVTAIAAGSAFAMALTDDGLVWTWGHNGEGQLGDGTLIDRPVPLRVAPFAGAFAVAAGGTHAAAITTDGRMWSWGTDRPSSLGAWHATPEPVVGVTGALAIAGGYLYTLAVNPDGGVIAWGTNNYGQLGDGSVTGEAAPVSTSGLSLANNAWLMGDQDGDSLPTWREYLIGTDPLNWDTSGWGVGDYVLVTSGFHAASCDPFGLNPVPLPPLPSDPLDHVPPVITLIAPTGARRIP